MPQQKGTHLEPENAEDNFHFHFTLWGGCFIGLPSAAHKWLSGWEEGHLEWRAVWSIPSRLWKYKGSECWALDWCKAQNNLQPVVASVTPSLTRHLARLEEHQQMQTLLLDFQLLCLLSSIHFTLWFYVDILCSVGILCLFKLLWNCCLFLCLLQRGKYIPLLYPFVKPLWCTAFILQHFSG